ncbi:hypothetical protein VP1G_10554 [Cytospora mali]|uniref:Uncharacterized protein n=1 Tax=Cytospora mali TaxID=578113 RepID=A0A194UMV6_CYTMA|nr:hypothetical protein VP1G_10554 [Valsa mali var. pyri (nom. inval.)]
MRAGATDKKKFPRILPAPEQIKIDGGGGGSCTGGPGGGPSRYATELPPKKRRIDKEGDKKKKRRTTEEEGLRERCRVIGTMRPGTLPNTHYTLLILTWQSLAPQRRSTSEYL